MVTSGYPISNLNTFISFIEQLETKLAIENNDFWKCENDRNNGIKFFNLITDPFRSSVTGSSVLAARINRDDFGNDIDIFIEDLSDFGLDSPRQIIENFLKSNSYWIKNLNRPQKISDKFFDIFGKTNSSSGECFLIGDTGDYPFDVGPNTLSSIKFSLNDSTLNFIFLKPKKNKRMLEKGILDLLLSAFSTNGQLNYISHQVHLETDFKLLGAGRAVEYISESFDMEELKYVYSFKHKDIITSFKQQQYLIESLIIDISNTWSDGNNKTKLLKGLSSALVDFKKLDQEHRSTFNDFKKLTVSKNLIHYNKGISLSDSYLNFWVDHVPEKEDPKFGNSFSLLLGLTKRIRKYTSAPYNFSVQDPTGVVNDLTFDTTVAVLHLLKEPVLEKVRKSSLLLSKKHDTKKRYKFITTTKKLTRDFLEQEITEHENSRTEQRIDVL